MLVINSVEGHKVIANIAGTRNHVAINLNKPIKKSTIIDFSKDQACFLGILVGIIGRDNEVILNGYDFDQFIDDNSSIKFSEISLEKPIHIKFILMEEKKVSAMKLKFSISNKDFLNRIKVETAFYMGFLYGYLEHKDNTIDLLSREMPYLLLS